MACQPLSRQSKGALAIIVLLALVACKQPTETVTPSEVDSTQQPESTATEEPIILQLTFGPGVFDLPDPAVGLSDLSGYQAALTLSFVGTREGQPYQWSRSYVMLAGKEPLSRQLTIEASGDNAGTVPLLMAEVNGAAYQIQSDNTCIASVIQQGLSLAEKWEPADMLSSIFGADEAGSETVSNVPSRHYTFDQRALGEDGIVASTGEVWIASEGGYVVKYILTTEGNEAYFGQGSEGTFKWDYMLTNINQPVAIELPSNCPAGMLDVPLMPDAAGLIRLPGLIKYTTIASVADVATFYQEQLPILGWQPLGEPSIAENSALLDFTLDNEKISLIITSSDAVTTIRIALGPLTLP